MTAAAAVLLRLRGGGGGVDQPVTATSGDDDGCAGGRGRAGCACRSLAMLLHLTILRSPQPPSSRALLPPATVTVADVMTQHTVINVRQMGMANANGNDSFFDGR